METCRNAANPTSYRYWKMFFLNSLPLSSVCCFIEINVAVRDLLVPELVLFSSLGVTIAKLLLLKARISSKIG